MVDVVIPFGFGSIWYNHEIRFCLRSVERYLHGVGKVWLIGKCPEFISNVETMPYVEKDNERVPDRDIAGKLMKACENPDISDPFLYMNDDHYILTDFQAAEFPNYYFETLTAYNKKRQAFDPYGKRALNSLKWLTGKGLSDNFYDIHYPMLIHKKPFVDSVGTLEWNKSNDGWIIKSIYGNFARVEGTPEKDYKSTQPPQPGAKVYSSYPLVKASVQRFLLEQFPTKSIYENRDIK